MFIHRPADQYNRSLTISSPSTDLREEAALILLSTREPAAVSTTDSNLPTFVSWLQSSVFELLHTCSHRAYVNVSDVVSCITSLIVIHSLLAESGRLDSLPELASMIMSCDSVLQFILNTLEQVNRSPPLSI